MPKKPQWTPNGVESNGFSRFSFATCARTIKETSLWAPQRKLFRERTSRGENLEVHSTVKTLKREGRAKKPSKSLPCWTFESKT